MKAFFREIPLLARTWRRVRNRRAARAATPVITKYLGNSSAPRLHLGCGGNVLPGWLNTDTFTLPKDVIFLDATRQFPFPDGAFHHILAEHMIEHITLRDARIMIKECKRVLAPGGILRVSTPGLERYLSLFQQPRSNEALETIKATMHDWIIPGFCHAKNYPPPAGNDADPTFVLNDLFLNYEHRFIYDQPNLERLLRDSGFTTFKQEETGQSRHSCFLGVETHTSPASRRLTLVIEAS